MTPSDPPNSEASTRPEAGAVPDRDALLGNPENPGLAKAIEEVRALGPVRTADRSRNFNYGSIEVSQGTDGAFTIKGAENVPAGEFVTFLEMLASFVRRGTTKTEIEQPLDYQYETRGESECPKCHSPRQFAESDMRKCLNCETEWRVLPLPPRKKP